MNNQCQCLLYVLFHNIKASLYLISIMFKMDVNYYPVVFVSQ